MSVFDRVFVPCPNCGRPVEFQSKQGEGLRIYSYALDYAPPAILLDVMNRPSYCRACETWLALVERKTLHWGEAKLRLKTVKVRAPEKPLIGSRGDKWWPDCVQFTAADVERTGWKEDLAIVGLLMLMTAGVVAVALAGIAYYE